MSPRTGRPPKETKKSQLLHIRLTEEMIEKLKDCAVTMRTSRTAVIEHGIDLVRKELGK